MVRETRCAGGRATGDRDSLRHLRLGDDDVMQYIGAFDIQTAGGAWVTLSALRDTQTQAWQWAENNAFRYYRRGVATRRLRVYPYRVRVNAPGQFDYLKGNEKCAREWQDGGFLL